jgi:hypothetical protein
LLRRALETRILLAKAVTEDQPATLVIRQADVFLFLHTDDFWRDYAAYRQRRAVPGNRAVEPSGTVAVFDDLYGNHGTYCS